MQPVHEQPQEMIRAIRQALGMTRAEFGRALGWAPSTISRWESGRAQPNRLAVKIILAFAEEHHVRYRPRRELVLRAPAPTPSLPALASQSPPSLGSIGSTMHSASSPVLTVLGPPAPDAWVASVRAERPRWEAALSLRVALDRRERATQSRQTWLRKASVAAATLGAALLIAIPMSRPPSTSSHARDERIASAAAVAAPAAMPAPDPRPAAAAPVSIPAASSTPGPAPATATLEGVTLLGDVRQAMFRTPTETITLTEGAQLGDRRATRIGAEGVELREPSGRLRMVGIGGRVPIE